MFANRAIYSDGWVAATTPPLAPWAVGKTIDVDDYKWELYDVTKDFSEANDLAPRNPKSSASCRNYSGSKRPSIMCCHWTIAKSNA